MKKRTFVTVVCAALVCSGSLSPGSPTPTVGSAVNLSVRVELNATAAIQGLVIEGTRVVLIRAIGPGLSAYNVAAAIADPAIVVTDQHGNDLGRGIPMRELSDEQYALITRACTDSGAFPVSRTSDDAVLLRPVSGIVTARVTSASSAAGEVLIEAYVLPWTEFDRATYVAQ